MVNEQDKKKILELKQQILDAHLAISAVLDKHLGGGEGQWHVVGDWVCPKSPIGLCVYKPIEDKAWDNCIFCHEPHERK